MGALGSEAGDECLPLFFYGTLRRGQAGAGLVEPFVARRGGAIARGRRLETGDAFPAVVFDSAGEDIPGEIVWLSCDSLSEVLDRLDLYEGVPDLFRRVPVRVRTDEGEIVAYAYEWAGSSRNPL